MFRILFALVSTSCVLASSALAETLSIRADYWAPINNDSREANRGIMIDVAEAILKPEGHSVDYKLLPWDEAKAGVAKGTYDCIVGALRSDIDSKFLLPKQPWVVSQQSVYARTDKDYGQITSVNDLSPFVLGVSHDYSYGPELDAYRDENLDDPRRIFVAHGSRPIRELLLRLSTNQIQLALETNAVMDYTIKQAKLETRIKAVGSPIKTRDELFIACSAAKSRKFVDLFDAGLPRLRADGSFAAILAKYGLKDWQ